MNTTIIIDGGLGRVITAIPALEIYLEKNPNTIIITHGWTPILWSNKKLSNNIFDQNSKGIIDLIKHTKIVKPEPYYNSDYICGKIHLIDAWNQEINNSKESILSIPQLCLTKAEIDSARFIRNNYYTKIVAFQPFGSTAIITDKDIKDQTARSLNIKTTQHLVKTLKDQGYGIWLICDKQIPFLDYSNFIGVGSNNIREVAALLYHCDYFLGIDSSGQHLARALSIPGSIIMGGTNTVNVTYPNHFNILNDRPDKKYMPYRIAEFDYWLSELNNADLLDFDDRQLHMLGKNIVKHINKVVKPHQQAD